MNPLVKAYLAVDNALMYGANKTVQGWNWLTGETKSQLANKLLTLAPIALAASYSYGAKPGEMPSAAMLTGGFLAYSHFFQNKNLRFEEKELNAAQESLKDPESEFYKNVVCRGVPAAHFGGSLALTGAVSAAPIEGDYGTNLGLFLGGQALYAGSFFLMRADSVPPRKSCFRRGLEKLVEGWDNYKEQKVLEPALVPVRRFQREMEVENGN